MQLSNDTRYYYSPTSRGSHPDQAGRPRPAGGAACSAARWPWRVAQAESKPRLHAFIWVFRSSSEQYAALQYDTRSRGYQGSIKKVAALFFCAVFKHDRLPPALNPPSCLQHALNPIPPRPPRLPPALNQISNAAAVSACCPSWRHPALRYRPPTGPARAVDSDPRPN